MQLIDTDSGFSAFFEVNVVQESHSIRQRLYCHAKIPEVMVMEIQILRNLSLAKLSNQAKKNYSVTSNPEITAVDDIGNRNGRAAERKPR